MLHTKCISPITNNDDRQVDSFFKAVIEYRIREGIEDKPVFILVCPLLPSLFPFLKAIKNIGDVAVIIPKGFQRNNFQNNIQELIKKKENSEIEYGYLLEPDNVADANCLKKKINAEGIQLITKFVQKKQFIIIDMGGYFSETFEKIVSEKSDLMITIRNNFLGIVEDTENGHQKYFYILEKLKQIKDLDFSQKKTMEKIYSVARCVLKNAQDYCVGKSIVEASGNILRVNGNTTLERMQTAGVLGFGKVGRSIAEHLRQKSLKEVIIYDSNVVAQLEASSFGFKIVSRSELIASSWIIFCATGKGSLKGEDSNNLKDNVFIVSVTSEEDEFDLSFRTIIKNQPKAKFGNILKVKLNDKSINLLDDGNAVNFLYGGVPEPNRYSVQAALLLSAINLIENNYGKTIEQIANLKCLNQNDIHYIAVLWLNFFENCKRNDINITSNYN